MAAATPEEDFSGIGVLPAEPRVGGSGDGDDPNRPDPERIAKMLRKAAGIDSIDIQLQPSEAPPSAVPHTSPEAGHEGTPMPNAWEDAPNQDPHAFQHDPSGLCDIATPPGLRQPPEMTPPEGPPPAGLSATYDPYLKRPPGFEPMMPIDQTIQSVGGATQTAADGAVTVEDDDESRDSCDEGDDNDEPPANQAWGAAASNAASWEGEHNTAPAQASSSRPPRYMCHFSLELHTTQL